MDHIKERREVPKEFQWNLERIFKTDEEFQKEIEAVRKQIDEFAKLEGHTTENAEMFYRSITAGNEIERRLNKLYTYASMKSDEDVANTENQAKKEQVVNLYNYASSKMYFQTPELLNTEKEVIESFYQAEPKLLEHKTNIEEVYRYKPHTLPKEEEKLLSNLSSAFGNDETTYGYLTDSDLDFGTIHDENGVEVPLTDTNFSIYIKSPKREVRKEAFERLYEVYKQFQNTITATFNGAIKQNVAMAHIKHYKTSFEAALFGDELDPKVYDTLVSSVRNHLDVLHDYYRLRKEVLNLKELHLYDVYTNLVPDTDTKYPFETASRLVLDALKPLGDAYINDLKQAFTESWIDIYPNKNKRGGAYSSGSYDTMPYVLLNYQDKLDDVSTLAHELGHSMHSFYTRKNQPYQYGDYPIFVAEVASTVNELLLAKHMLKVSTNKNERLAILNQLLELFKGTIYRQVMFAEFEKYAYDLVEQDEVITPDKLCKKYYELNQDYFGSDVVVDKEIAYEWEKVPHFYYHFYVYKYATGISAACHIVEGILSGDEAKRDAYLKMLANGCRENPLNTLKIAGVDMTDKEVYESAIRMFADTIEEFRNELKS
ncbi:MAG TPA: oligoendopeptidase F [Candidatus Faecenecus gallistercoris]|uniref:Oligopeptidase F n=1 Tax=Candidatus Faecenecus gallistercoris TaxID=2840793 RepID=A0A9D1CJH7_9FIRM|nr:oligoendopeptidase F [Candidatus Faecenecus gallistercoris]